MNIENDQAKENWKKIGRKFKNISTLWAPLCLSQLPPIHIPAHLNTRQKLLILDIPINI